jgi:hypothetical protein
MFSYPVSFLQTRAPEIAGKPLQKRLESIGWRLRLPQSLRSADSTDRFFSLDAAAEFLDDVSSSSPAERRICRTCCLRPAAIAALQICATSLFSHSI